MPLYFRCLLMEHVMKVVVLVMLVCVMGVDSNIYSFFSMLGDGLTVQFQNAWGVIKEFIKRPPRFKRILEENAKTTPEIDQDIQPCIEYDRYLPPCTDMVTTATTNEMMTTKPMQPDMMYYFQRLKHKQVLLPIIRIPKWKTRDDWFDIQQPNLGFLFRGGRGQSSLGAKDRERGMKPYTITKNNDFYADVTTDKQLDDENDEEDLGVMMFV